MVLAEELREEIEELKGDSLSDLANKPKRILSGMRPTGRLHLGHYKGVLENWRYKGAPRS